MQNLSNKQRLLAKVVGTIADTDVTHCALMRATDHYASQYFLKAEEEYQLTQSQSSAIAAGWDTAAADTGAQRIRWGENYAGSHKEYWDLDQQAHALVFPNGHKRGYDV